MNQYTVTVNGRDYDVDAPDENTAWQWANQFASERTKRMDAATAADIAKNKADFAASEAERPWAERALTNVGAGMDTAWQGLKQLVGQGPDDAELAEQRRMKQQLAEGTTGGGALQLAGEIAPTLAVPGGAAAAGVRNVAGRMGGQALVKALAPRALKTAALDAGLMGGVAGALQPVMSNESRAMNTALGAAGGGVGAGAIGAAAKYAPRLTAAGRNRAALERGGGRLVDELGPDAAGAAQAIEQFTAGRLNGPAPNVRGVTQDIPLTTAQTLGVTGGPGATKMAAMELGTRGSRADEFAELAQRQNRALYEATERAGVEGTEQFVNAADAARSLATDPMRQNALQAAGRWPEVGAPLQAQTAALRGSSAAGTPSRRLADLVDSTLTENPTPEQLYSLRKLLASKLNGPMTPGDDVASIVKGAERDALQMMKAIDARLDEAATRKGGPAQPWSDYLREYTEKSRPVASGRAQQQIRQALAPEGGAMVGGAPEVTRHRLSKAVERFGRNRQGFDRLTPDARSRYDELLGFMQGMEDPMRSVKLGGTAGGGAQTATQLGLGQRVGEHALQGVAEMAVPGGGFATGAAMAAGRKSAQQEVAQLMLDPTRAAQAIRAKLAQNLPLTTGEKLFLQATRGVGVGLPAALMQPATTQ